MLKQVPVTVEPIEEIIVIGSVVTLVCTYSTPFPESESFNHALSVYVCIFVLLVFIFLPEMLAVDPSAVTSTIIDGSVVSDESPFVDEEAELVDPFDDTR